MNLDRISLGDDMSVNDNKDTENSIDNNDINQDELNKFLKNVELYFEIETEIDKISTELKKKKKICKDYYEQLLDYMNQYEIKNHTSINGEIKYTVKYQKERMNNKVIKYKLAQYFNSNEKALDCYKFLDNRDKVEKIQLKFIKKKFN